LPRVKHRLYFSLFGGLAATGHYFFLFVSSAFLLHAAARAATSFNTKFEGLSLATVARHRYYLHSP
jgi:hypothetical protein